MKKSGILKIFLITLMISANALIIISCNQSDIGIFYGIENEEKIVDRSLSNSLTIGAMDKLGSTLFIAAGKVYKKASGTNNEWAKCSTPSGYDLCTSLTVFEDTTIFAVWFNKDSAETAFLKSLDGNSWTSVSGTFSGDFSLVKSAHAASNDGVIVVSTVTGSNTGNFYTSTDGTTFNPINGVNALGGHFDIDYDNSNYWFLTKENIYEENNNDLTTLPAASQGKVDDDEYFNFIYAYDENHVYATRSLGEFGYYNGTTWNNSVENLSINANDMIVFEVNSTPTFFAGTDRYGYYEPTTPGLSIEDLDRPESDSITCDYQTYNASDLRYSAVLGFYKDDLTGNGDTSDDELYALTYGEGLWKNIDDNGERVWQRE